MPTYKLQEKFERRCRKLLSSHDLDADDDHLSFSAERAAAVSPALVRYAESKDVDMIAMGTHGRRGVERAFCGGVAEEALRTAPPYRPPTKTVSHVCRGHRELEELRGVARAGPSTSGVQSATRSSQLLRDGDTELLDADALILKEGHLPKPVGKIRGRSDGRRDA